MVEQQKDLLTNRWRKVKAPEPLEVELQIALIQHLHFRARRGVVYFHPANGELRDKKSAAKLKAMGVLPGVADLVFVWFGDDGVLHNLYLELKARGRKPTPEQYAFAQAIRDAGAEYDFADSLDEALKLLDARGLLRSNPLR